MVESEYDHYVTALDDVSDQRDEEEWVLPVNPPKMTFAVVYSGICALVLLH